MRSFNRIHPVPAAVGGVVVGLSIALAVPAIAQLDLNTFQAGETTSAGDVNENFEDLSDAVRHLEDRLEAIEENKDFVEALNKYLEIYTEDEDAPEDTAVKTPLIRMTGANLQIVNQAEAQTTPDGTGNLVVGLAEERDFNVSGIDGEACSDGLIENAADCIGADETWSISHNTGSHNIVGGQQPAYSQTGGLVVGENNLINRTNANVTGGQLNIASGLRATVGGGSANTANSSNSTVSGGSRNTASGSASSVSGGRNNTASSSDSVVSGGWLNTASGARSTVGGGIKSTLGDNEGCEVDDFNEWGASPSTGGALGDCAE